jgi:hypothetical protein
MNADVDWPRTTEKVKSKKAKGKTTTDFAEGKKDHELTQRGLWPQPIYLSQRHEDTE